MADQSLPQHSPTVQTKSLPHCLRHGDSKDALRDAGNIVSFLDHFSYMASCLASGDDDLSMNESEVMGFSLLIRLLKDKLDIASGTYKFPFIAFDVDAPLLAERTDEGDEE